MDKSELVDAITAQGNVVRTLKASGQDAAQQVQTLQGLKAQLAALTGTADVKGKDKKPTKFTLKTPKVSPNLSRVHRTSSS